MKAVLLVTAALISMSAMASTKSYDCTAPGEGTVTKDNLAVVVYKNDAGKVTSVVVQPKGEATSRLSKPSSFRRLKANEQTPKALEKEIGAGAEIFPTESDDVLFTWGNKGTHEVLYAIASQGLVRSDKSGYIKFWVKQNNRGEESTNKGEETREYGCEAK